MQPLALDVVQTQLICFRITKAIRRVGEGPFPTELKDDVGELLGTREGVWDRHK